MRKIKGKRRKVKFLTAISFSLVILVSWLIKELSKDRSETQNSDMFFV